MLPDVRPLERLRLDKAPLNPCGNRNKGILARRARKLVRRLGTRIASSGPQMTKFPEPDSAHRSFGTVETCRCHIRPITTEQAGPTRPHRLAGDTVHRCRCHGAAGAELYPASPVADSQSFAQPTSALRAPGGQLPPPAQTLLADSAPSAAPSPEQEKLGQLFRGFLAVVEQEIEELKTSIEQLKSGQEQMVRNNSALSEQIKAAQEQIARDNAVIAEQLKATQEQLSRLFAKTSEQQPRPKTSAPRSIATSAGKPVPKPSSSQTRAQPVRGRSEKQ